MCGIGGAVFTAQRPEELRAIGAKMVEALHHRGPDANGVAVLPGAGGVFAHTRLKIIDLSERAAQPFVSDDGQVALTFNGEIYNFQALREALVADGVKFHSDSDTEVILRQFERHGVEGLDALDGMFAFAIWDARERRLVIMRDRVGKKPLYWTRTASGAVVFGSEAKALFHHPEVERGIDPGYLPELLTYGYVSTPHSLYRELHKLPPASRLIVTEGHEPRIESYWRIDADAAPLDLDVESAKQLVRESVGAAVERRMVADVPLGAFLSGGIDSSIVVAEMAKRSSKRVRTFCVGFDEDKTFDESSYAADIGRRFDTDHTEIRLKALPTDLFEELLAHHDEPYGDSSALAVYAVSKATREHVTVVLTGDGGDEVHAGYTRFRGGLLSSYVPSPIAGAARRVLSRVPRPRGYKHPVALLQRFVEHSARTHDEQLLAWNSYFAGDRLAELMRDGVSAEQFDPWRIMRGQAAILASARSSGSDRLDQILRHNLATYLLDDLLVKTDRMTMSVALEARSPFLDTQLIEQAFRIPSQLKLRRFELKWLLREAYRDVLPTSVLDRKKHGFGVPVGTWWSGAAAPMVDDLLVADGARCGEYLDHEVVRRIVREHRGGTHDHSQRIFVLLQLELWLRSLASPSTTKSATIEAEARSAARC